MRLEIPKSEWKKHLFGPNPPSVFCCLFPGKKMESNEFSEGSIVWVWRSNGSWWPGKIVGMSPRSVKLLGRDNATVDWYNLDKSKCVKAFRCGEFDDCIGRAESLQRIPIKKRERYARREDAIFQALELEKELLNKHGKSGATSGRSSRKSPGALRRKPISFSGSIGNDKRKCGDTKSHNFLEKLDTAKKDEIFGSLLCLETVKEENDMNLEDDNSEATPRMRGLQDFGLRIDHSKRKLSSSAVPNGSKRRPSVENISESIPAHSLSMGSASHGNGKHSLDKRNMSNEGLAEDIFLKRRDRRRPLVQVLQSSAKLEISHHLQSDSGTVSTCISGVGRIGVISRAKRSKCMYLPTESRDSLEYKEIPASHYDMPPSRFGEGSCHPRLGSFLEHNVSGCMEGVGSDSSDTGTDSSKSDSDDDSSEPEPEIDKEMAMLSEADQHAPEALGEYENWSNEELDKPPNSGDIYVHANKSVCIWKSKGKRNVRSLSRRYMDASNMSNFNFGQRTLHPNLGFLRSDGFYDGIKGDWNEKDIGGQMGLVGNGAYPFSSRYKRCSMFQWEDSTWEDQTVLGRYWKEKPQYFDSNLHGCHHVGGKARPILVEVDLKVQARYQKQPVPLVSLMSKLNGNAIIGHPIEIQTLEDGSTETLLYTINGFGNVLDYGNTAIPPAWTTSRRIANSWIPRPHMQSALDTNEATQDLLFNERSSSHKAGTSVTNGLYVPRPPTDRKFQKKVTKSSPSPSQKTRTLSSIAVEQKCSSKHVLDSNCQMEGQIKLDSIGPTTVACIPVKLVFSRLLEKINRSPSKTVSNMVGANSHS